MARGYQGPNGDVKALAMKKWFNTNYHYLVPELDDDTQITLTELSRLMSFLEAKTLGIITKPVIIAPLHFLSLRG
jgi:5-methyltetrahydropteroyltriglutamate--homocysteine methyltransferase